MAAPNIVSVTNIVGKTNVLSVNTTPTSIVTNPGSSNSVYKINSLILSNINGSSATDISVDLNRGGTAYYLAYTISVPADSTLVAISKDAGIYLEEGDSIRVVATSNAFISGICSYEVIS